VAIVVFQNGIALDSIYSMLVEIYIYCIFCATDFLVLALTER